MLGSYQVSTRSTTMATPYQTPTKRKGSPRKTPWTKPSMKKTKAVDLVTGKTTVEYFFDPSLVIQGTNGSETPFKTPKDTRDPLFFSSKHLFMPCTIIKPLDEENNGSAKLNTQPYAGPTLVKTSDGTLHKISDSTKLVPLQAPDDYVGMEDVLHLPQISEASLLHSLRIRYRRDEIYTSAGPILISINPYKQIILPEGESLYSEEQMMLYRTRLEFEEKPPHLFQIADRAYTALMDSVHSSTLVEHMEDEDAVMMLEHQVPPGTIRDQSIIISGESGAGKTEATKIIMKYLARITRKADKPSFIQSPDGKMVAALEDRVLSSNPLLETFGNAQTLRNDNSSRFGKFIHIYFNTASGSITGASISNYLLEKTRITTQVDGERNYHIFYQLLSGADKETLVELGLEDGASSFHYLGYCDDTENSSKDGQDLLETMQCLKSIGVKEDRQKALFGIAAAVLHLGNIQFEERGEDDEGDAENAKISEMSLPSLKKACELLGLDEDKLSEAILTKLLNVNGKTIKKPQNVAMAEDKRDALAKMTYSCLFLWLVNSINETLSMTSLHKSPSKSEQTGFIGVLDIYGFECFETNGFEQLLINYCNEKLQRHFNRHLFEVEQELYANEGVDWSYITFNDNRPCLELIEGGSGIVGILNTLDDAWGGMGTAAEKDGKFVTHLHKLFGSVSAGDTKKTTEVENGHKNFVTPKFGSDRHFVVVHYAGEVRYTADGFVEKNMETLSNELRELGDESTQDLSKEVYACANTGDSSAPQRSSIRGVSVGSQFRTSLQSLVADLDCTQPHYIRCIKPNINKASASFMSGEVLKQLRYSGMMEAIRIRREGYALREGHESFYNRFSVLLNPEDINEEESGIVQLVTALSKRLGVTDADWQIGHSKIFLRRELSDKLETMAKLRVHAAARTVGRFGKHVAYTRLSKLLVAWTRFRLRMVKIYRERRAASKLVAAVRRYKQQRLYHSVRMAVIQIQAEQRRKIAFDRVRKIRDPYCDMSYRECRRLLRSEQKRMDEFVKAKNFRAAAKLEGKIDSIKEAVERKRPLTRAVLDARIEETQQLLDDAVQRKAFNECGPLQDKLEELTKKRAEVPTIDELRDKVREAEEAVALAAKNRDFAGAAEGQARIDEAKQRLADALAAEEDDDSSQGDSTGDKENQVLGYESRAQLEQDIVDITKQVKAAIDSKDFAKASTLQQALDEREGLRKLFPTVQELEDQLKGLRDKLEEAICKKDFAKAGKLDGTVAELEKRIESEKEKMSEIKPVVEQPKTAITTSDGEEKVFDSRGELEKEISKSSALVSEAVAAKEFKRADALQADVDALIKLREYLPSVAELEDQLRQKRKEMELAIASKKFAKADEINFVIEELEKTLEKEKILCPPPKPSPPPKRKAKIADARSIKTLPVSSGASAPFSVRSTYTTPARPPVKPPSEFVTPMSGKTVAKLRPAKPLTAESSDSILEVTKLLANKRGNASVIVGPDGGLAGILTDTDITRRVVAKSVDPAAACVSEVMTPNPTCVALGDSAMDALTTMVENHFRHLPVVDGNGTVVGLLDIAKCLNDAITKLERAQDKNSSAAESAVKQMVKSTSRTGGDAQAAALQALLGNLMSEAFGSKDTPTLRCLLADKPSTVVSPNTSIRDAGLLMAESRKAALVVEDGHLVGIFGFKDMMSRAVAKELGLEETPVSAVMTPEPEAVSPDITVLEALQTMHDNRFLTLPVCEQDGSVVGLVDVMDVIYGCGGAEGWRSMFSSTMDLDDDVSDVSSVNSITSGRGKSIMTNRRSEKASLQPLTESSYERPVSKLRPTKPIIAGADDSILSVTQLLASKRGSASLIVSNDGGLAGILTDTDVTRRVVAKHIDPSSTNVSEVMTQNPTCVNSNDPAMDALTTMVENHFRHLPVVDSSGSIVGLLDIAKCLNDAITKLERAQDDTSSTAEVAVKQAVLQQGATGTQAEALQALLGNLMSQAFGNKTTPTLRSLLAKKPSTIVGPSTSIRDAALVMAENRKAALVVDEGRLAGIFGFKDMMSRAVARELDLEETQVSVVMTPDPEAVSPDITVLEALQTMHDHRFLTLPVCEDDGTVVGLVDVMDVIYGCGGAEGWRSMFNRAMELTDDQSDAASVHSTKSMQSSIKTGRRGRAVKREDKTVAKLRPSRPNITISNESILSVTRLLQRKRASASLIVGPEGGLVGILTDTDITRRVVAKNVNPSTDEVSKVMTPNPTCVSLNDSAMDALTTMVENHFRHLPVVDGEGSVVGLLDIAKCLNDAITKLERAQDKNSSMAENAVRQVVNTQSGGDAQAAALQALLGNLMSQAFGNKTIPTLRTLLAKKPSTLISPTTTIRDAAHLMAESRKAALVVEEGELVGIFGFKDMMSRAVAKELDLNETEVSAVMTPNPEAVSPDITVLEALQTMHDNRFLTLPVCEESGAVVGLVDVMDVIYGCGGTEGWRSMFSSAMEIEDNSDADSARGSRITADIHSRVRSKRLPTETPFATRLPGNIPATLEFDQLNDENSFNGSTIGDERGVSKLLSPDDLSASMIAPIGVFKVSEPSGKTHRIRCEARISDLLEALVEKVSIPERCIQLQYVDEEGDTVAVTSDDDVAEAWNFARKSGNKVAKLNLLEVEPKSNGLDTTVVAGVGAAIIIVSLVTLVLLKPKKA